MSLTSQRATVHMADTVPIQFVDELMSVGSPVLLGVVVLLFASVVAVYTYSQGEDEFWSVDELSEEEQKVVELLESNDGDVKQKKIATELDWSDAKASRLTTSLEEKNVLEKKMVERENKVELNSSDRKERS